MSTLNVNTIQNLNTLTASGQLLTTGQVSVGGNLLMNSGYGSAAVAYGCRAWVNFNGTGAVSINQTMRGSGNVFNVFKNAVGDYTINFTTAMPDANYCVQVTAENPGSTGAMGWGIKNGTTPTVSAVNVINYQSGTGIDRLYVNVAIFR